MLAIEPVSVIFYDSHNMSRAAPFPHKNSLSFRRVDNGGAAEPGSEFLRPPALEPTAWQARGQRGPFPTADTQSL